MKKFFKLSGVSILAIFCASGANAAGYTCEELIEYTSCNDGYALTNGMCLRACDAGYELNAGCPDGYSFGYSLCKADVGEDYNIYTVSSRSACEPEDNDGTYEFLGDGCWFQTGTFSDGHEFDFIPLDTSDGLECVACPVGKYSVKGQNTCSSCPETGLIDKNGETVVATTATSASTSSAACFVDSNVTFADDKGEYHYKSNCTYGNYPYMFPLEADECPVNYISVNVDGYDSVQCVYLPEDRCNQMHVWDEDYELYLVSWNETGQKCECEGTWRYNSQTDEFECEW